MTKVQKTDNVQANYNAQNNKKVKKQEAGKKAVFNKAKKSANTFTDKSGKTYEILGVVKGSKRGHLVVKDIKTGKQAFASANHVILKESYVKACMMFDNEKTKKVTAKNNGKSYVVLKENVDRLGRKLVMNQAGQQFYMAKDNTVIKADYAQGTAYVENVKHKIRTTKNAKEKARLEKELDSRASYSDKNIIRIKGDNNKFWYIDKRTGRAVNLTQKEADAIIKDLDDAAGGFLGTGIGTKDSKLLRTNQSIVDPAVLNRIDKHYAQDKSFQKDVKNGKYKSHYEAFLGSEISKDEVYKFDADLVKQGAIVDQKRRNEILLTNLTTYGKKFDNRHSALDAVTTKEDYNYLQKGAARFNKANNVKAGKGETALESLIAFQTEDDANLIDLSFKKLFAPEKNELTTQAEKTGINTRTNVKLILSGVDENIDTALDSHDSEMYAQMDKLLPANKKLATLNKKSDLMMAGYGKFSNEDLANEAVRLLNEAKSLSTQYASSGENVNSVYALKGAIKSSSSDYQHKSDTNLAKAYGIIKNPEVLALVEKKCPWFKSVVVDKKFPKNYTTEDYLFYNRVTNNKIADFANIALESSKVDPKLKKEDIEANKEQIKELKAIFNSLRNEHSFDVNGENEKMKLISRMRSATLLGQTKEDTRDTYRVAQSVLQKLELASEGKLVDKNGKHIPFEQAVKKYTGMNLAEVNQKYLQHQQYGEIAADLTIGMATAPLGGGLLKVAGTTIKGAKMLAEGTNLVSKVTRAVATGSAMGAGQYAIDGGGDSTFESRALRKEKAIMVAEFGGAGSLVGEISGGIASNMTSKAKALGVHTVGAGADVAIGGAIMEMNGQSYKDFLKDPLAMGMMAFAHVSSARSSMAKFSPANKAKTLMAMHKQGEAVKDLPTMNAEQRASFEKLNLPDAKAFLKESGIQYTEVKGGIEFTDANGAHRVQYDKTGAFQETKTQKLGISSKEVEDLVTYAEKGHANAEQVKAELGSKLTPEQTARLDKTIAKNQPAQQKSEVETIREELQNANSRDDFNAIRAKIEKLPKNAQTRELFTEYSKKYKEWGQDSHRSQIKAHADDVTFDPTDTSASVDAMLNRDEYVPENSTAPNKKGRVREWLNKKFSSNKKLLDAEVEKGVYTDPENNYLNIETTKTEDGYVRTATNKESNNLYSKEYFDAKGKKISTESYFADGYLYRREIGNTTERYVYTDNGKQLLDYIEYPKNKQVRFEYDQEGNLTSMTFIERYNQKNPKEVMERFLMDEEDYYQPSVKRYDTYEYNPAEKRFELLDSEGNVALNAEGKPQGIATFNPETRTWTETGLYNETIAPKATKPAKSETPAKLEEETPVAPTETEAPAPAEGEIIVGGGEVVEPVVVEPVVAEPTVEIPKPISERLGIKFNGRGSRMDNITSEKATKTSKPQKIEIDGETYTLEQQYTSGRFGRNKKVAVETIKDGDRIVEQRVFNENGQPELVVRNNENGSQTQIEYKDGVETQITTTTAEGDHFLGFDDAYKPNAEIGKCLQEGGITLTDGTQTYYDALGNEYKHTTIENADGTTARQWQIRDKKTGNFVEYKPAEHAITPHGVKAQSSFSVKATFNKVIDRLRPNKSAKHAETETPARLEEETPLVEETPVKYADAKAEEIVKQLDIKPSQEGSTFEVSRDFLNEIVNGKEVKYYELTKDADGTLKVSNSYEYKFDNEGNRVQTIRRDANGNVKDYQYGNDYYNNVRTDTDGNIISSLERVSHDNQTYTITKNNSNKITKIEVGDDWYYIAEQDGKTTFTKQHWDGKGWSKGEVIEKPEWFDTVANKASSQEELLKTLKEKVPATENETPVVKPVKEETPAKYADAKAEEIAKQLGIEPQEGATLKYKDTGVGEVLIETKNKNTTKYYCLEKDANGNLEITRKFETLRDNKGNTIQTINRNANDEITFIEYGNVFSPNVHVDVNGNITSSKEIIYHNNQKYTVEKYSNGNIDTEITFNGDTYRLVKQNGQTKLFKSEGMLLKSCEKPEWWDTVYNKASNPEDLLKTLKEKVSATENETPVVKPVEEEAPVINLNEEPVIKPEEAKPVENEAVAPKSNETSENVKPTEEKVAENSEKADNKVTDKSSNKPSQYADKATEETVNKLGIKPSQKGSTFEYKDGRLHEVVDGKEVRLYFLEKDASGNPTKVTDSYETTYDKNGEVIEQVIKKGDKVIKTDYNLKDKNIITDENGDVITSTENITHDNQQYSIKKDKSDKITRIEVGDDVYHVEEKDGKITFTNEHRGSDGKYSEPKPVDKPEWYDSVAGKASKQKDLLKQAQKEVKADGVGQKHSGSRLKKLTTMAVLGGLAYGGKLVYDSYKEKSEAVTPVDPAEETEQEEHVEEPVEEAETPTEDAETPDADNQSSEVADNDTNNNGSSSASDENHSSVDDSNNSSNTDNSAPADDTNRSREAESNDTDNNKVEDKKTEKKEKVTTPSEENGVKNDETQNGEHVVTIGENLENLNKMTSDIHTVEDFNNFVERLKLERENENITDEDMKDLIAKARTNMEPETTPVQEVNDETTTDTTSEEKVEDVVNNDKPVQTPTTKGKQEITPDVRMSLVEDIQNAKEVSDIREIQRKIRQYKRFPGRKNLRRAYKAKLREIRHQDKAEAKAQKYADKFNERMDKIMSSDIYKNDQNQLNLKKPKGNSIFG